MGGAHAQTFDPAGVTQLSAALRIRKTGAYAFVAFASDDDNKLDELRAPGFSLDRVSTQSGVVQYRTRNAIATRRRGPKPQATFREVRGKFFLSKLITPRAFVFVTPERDEYVRDGLSRFLYRARERFTRARLTSREMLNIVLEMARATSSKVVTNRSLIRSKRNEATISYKAESIKEVYEYARESNANVSGFDFSLISREGELLLRAGLNRDGKLSFHSGSTQFFIKEFIEIVAQTVKSRTDLLSNRARSEETGSVRPLRLTFEKPLLTDAANIRSFLEVLGRIRHGEFTLFHRNPYLHLNFFDFFDASAFDVVVESTESLVVVPQLDSSLPSLFRLCQKIFEQFEEGVVTDATDVVTTPSLPPGWND
jgi:hypothetical protein